MSDRDKTSSGEGEKRRRNRRRGGGNGKAQRRNRGTSAMYRRKVDEKLFGKKGDRARLRLTERLRDAYGTPNFHRTFREYLRSYGLPEDIALLMLLLDLDNERDVVRVLEGIETTLESISVDEKSLLRKRLRNLEMSTAFDGVADATVELLERL